MTRLFNTSIVSYKGSITHNILSFIGFYRRGVFYKGGVQVPECLSAFCLRSVLFESQVAFFRSVPCQLPLLRRAREVPSKPCMMGTGCMTNGAGTSNA